jgi:hypothetical protein
MLPSDPQEQQGAKKPLVSLTITNLSTAQSMAPITPLSSGPFYL